MPLGLLTGMWPRRCFVELGAGDVTVAMGWAFRARIPRPAIEAVQPARVGPWAGVGVHGWRGTWVVNGTLRGMVEVVLRDPVPARLYVFPVRLRRLFVSVDDPEGLAQQLRSG